MKIHLELHLMSSLCLLSVDDVYEQDWLAAEWLMVHKIKPRLSAAQRLPSGSHVVKACWESPATAPAAAARTHRRRDEGRRGREGGTARWTPPTAQASSSSSSFLPPSLSRPKALGRRGHGTPPIQPPSSPRAGRPPFLSLSGRPPPLARLPGPSSGSGSSSSL